MQISAACSQASRHERELDLWRKAEKLAELILLIAVKVFHPVHASGGEGTGSEHRFPEFVVPKGWLGECNSLYALLVVLLVTLQEFFFLT